MRWAAALAAQPSALGGDANGNVYVMMDVFAPGADEPVTQLWKFDGAGARQWTLALGPGLWGSREMAVTPAGDVVIGACSAPFCFAKPDGPSVEASLVRVSAAGSVLWTVRAPGSGFWSLDADARGRTLAAVNTPQGARVVMLDADGLQLLDMSTHMSAPRAAFGGESGDFVVGGQDLHLATPVFERRRSDGTARFTKTIDTPEGGIDRIDFAPNGSIALAGAFFERLTWGEVTHTQSSSGFLAVGGGDGSAQWSKEDFALQPFSSVPPKLAFGRDNDVVVFTMTFGKGQANLRSYTRDGALRWQHEFSGIFGTWVNALAVAANGDVVVGGNGTGDAPFQGLAFAQETHFVAGIAP